MSNRQKRIRRPLIDERGEIPVKSGRISPPTGNRRHITAIREGKVSGEIFCQDPKRREQLGLPLWVVEE
jgi:hypothetical protein